MGLITETGIWWKRATEQSKVSIESKIITTRTKQKKMQTKIIICKR